MLVAILLACRHIEISYARNRTCVWPCCTPVPLVDARSPAEFTRTRNRSFCGHPHLRAERSEAAFEHRFGRGAQRERAPANVTRRVLTGGIQTASLETNAQGDVISYEEYHPYGTSAFRLADSAAGVSARRYRYTGKERDEETSLYYHGARYYAPWLGRWTAADPAGMVDGLNLYRYSRDNPIRYSDPGGTESKMPTQIDRVVAATMFGGRQNDVQASNMDAFLAANYGKPGSAGVVVNTANGKRELRRTVAASGSNPIDIVRDIGTAAQAISKDSAPEKAVALVLHGNTDRLGRRDPGIWLTEDMLLKLKTLKLDLNKTANELSKAERALESANRRLKLAEDRALNAKASEKSAAQAALAKAREAVSDASDEVASRKANHELERSSKDPQLLALYDAFESSAKALKDAGVDMIELQACNTGARSTQSPPALGFTSNLETLLSTGGHQVHVVGHEKALSSMKAGTTVEVWVGGTSDRGKPGSQSSTKHLPVP